jgi:hypothetical protein
MHSLPRVPDVPSVPEQQPMPASHQAASPRSATSETPAPHEQPHEQPGDVPRQPRHARHSADDSAPEIPRVPQARSESAPPLNDAVPQQPARGSIVHGLVDQAKRLLRRN